MTDKAAELTDRIMQRVCVVAPRIGTMQVKLLYREVKAILAAEIPAPRPCLCGGCGATYDAARQEHYCVPRPAAEGGRQESPR